MENEGMPQENEQIDCYDQPLSPVLCNNNRKILMSKKMQRKSRVKLQDRFPSEGKNDANEGQEQVSSLSDETLTPSQEENIKETIKIFEKIEADQCKVQTLISQENEVKNFEFKKPLSPSLNTRKIKCEQVSKSITFKGFQTAAGKSIKLSEAHIEKSKTLFNDILNPVKTEESRCNKYSFLSKDRSKTHNVESKIDSEKFKNVISPKLHKNEHAIAKNNKLLSFTKEETHQLNEFGGFRKASGKDIQVTESALRTAKNMFGDEFTSDSKFYFEPLASNLETSDKKHISMFSSEETDQLFCDFTLIEQDMLNQIDVDSSKNTDKSEEFKGFNENMIEESNKNAKKFIRSIEKMSTKEKSQQIYSKRSLHEAYNLPNQKRFKPANIVLDTESSTNFQGFKSASGNAMNIAKSSLDRARQIFKDINLSHEGFTDAPPHRIINKTVNDENLKLSVGFQTASGNAVHLSENVLKKAKQLFENIDNFGLSAAQCSKTVMHDNQSLEEGQLNTSGQNLSSLSSSGKPNRKKRLGTSSYRPIQISSDKFERAKLLFEDERSVGPSPIKTNNATIYSSTPLRQSSNVYVEPNITPIKSTSDEVTVEYLPQCIETVGDGRILIVEHTKGDVKSWSENLEIESRRLETKLKIIAERKEALNRQKCILDSDCQDYRKRSAGVLYSKKQYCNRIQLRNILKPNNLLNKFSYISPQKAELVHFNCSQQCLPSINTLDGACVIPNVKDLVGLSEIEMAFITMPGIEPKLIPEGWVRNHFKWIVWKLASYERFATNLQECLTIENVMQQLKYRYDREIDMAERSTLRKIFEKDDVPQKRMVLCVSNIFNLPDNKIELELTDGWYSIRTVIDQRLCMHVRNKKIMIGTKLITCGAELLNCEGCHPLEAIDTIRLKISCNSTRRAVWYAKLGFQKLVEPFPLMLKSVFPDGGYVGCIKIYIARVYPIKYLEKKNKLSVWRNKKAEEIKAQDWEQERLKKIEEIREIARKDYEQNLQTRKVNLNTNLKSSNIKNVKCPETLYNLYQSSNDPESFQEMLSECQKNAIMDYQQRLSFIQQQEMNSRVQEGVKKLQFSQRDVTPVQQLLIMDVLDSQQTATVFQIWKPSESHLQLLRESTVFYVYNVIPKKNGLSSTSRTKFKADSQECPQYDKYKRVLLPISVINNSVNKPPFNEFDTVGIIVQVSVNTFDQSLWLADTSGSLLLVKVFEGPKNCLLLDNLKSGQIVAVSNLILDDRKFEFSEAIANHSTIISCYPQHKHLQEGIQKLNEDCPKELKSFLIDCNEKVTYYVDKIYLSRESATRSSNSLVQLNALNNSDVFDDSHEESTLIYSRITSTDVALSMIDIDKLT